jgi:hypothetical protein
MTAGIRVMTMGMTINNIFETYLLLCWWMQKVNRGDIKDSCQFLEWVTRCTQVSLPRYEAWGESISRREDQRFSF